MLRLVIILSWNCRGLGILHAVPILRDLVWSHKLNVMFLSKTLVHANKVEEINRIVGFDNCFAV
ncbi:hypothetical protein JHK86_024463 [Glycine max]|nr:hypothetical protein JHK86_024463 [Glycine max]